MSAGKQKQRQRRLRKTKAELLEELESLDAKVSGFQDAPQTTNDNPALDLSARQKQIEAELTASEARLRTALEYMTGGLFMFSKDLKVEVMSPNFWDMYEMPQDFVSEGESAIPILRFRAERGDYGPGDPDELLRERIEGYMNFEFNLVQDRVGDRTMELFRAPPSDGGIVGVPMHRLAGW